MSDRLEGPLQWSVCSLGAELRAVIRFLGTNMTASTLHVRLHEQTGRRNLFVWTCSAREVVREVRRGSVVMMASMENLLDCR